MMNRFISHQSITRKALKLMVVVLCLASAILVYNAASRLTNTILSLRPYYWKAYALGLESRLLNPSRSNPSPSSGIARSVPVLVYHGLLNKADGENVLFNNFKDQLYVLKAAGYQTITMQQFHDFIRKGTPVPDRSFMIVFDDGRKDSFYPADPILEALGYHASMALIVDRLQKDSNFYLTVPELKSMLASGRWDFISHGDRDHDLYQIDAQGKTGRFMPNKLWLKDQSRLETDQEYLDRITTDLKSSQQDLTQMFDTPIFGYALPFSDYGQGITNYSHAIDQVLPTMKNTYPISFYEMWRGGNFLTNYPQPNTTSGVLIKRILVQPAWSANDLVSILEGIQAKNPNYPLGTPAGAVQGWTPNWGDSGTIGKELRIASRPDSSGGSMFLDGSYDWQDYRFDATIDWIKGNSALLLSRMLDDQNYVACVFAGDHVQIQQSIDGNQHVIKGAAVALGGAPRNDFRISMIVSGRTVQCMANGSVVVSSAFLDPVLSHGGIGFKSWDPQNGNSEMVIKDMGVTALNGRGVMDLSARTATP